MLLERNRPPKIGKTQRPVQAKATIVVWALKNAQFYVHAVTFYSGDRLPLEITDDEP